MEPDLKMIAEDRFETAMQLVQDKEWKTLKGFLDQTDDVTSEAIRESLNAEDFANLMRV